MFGEFFDNVSGRHWNDRSTCTKSRVDLVFENIICLPSSKGSEDSGSQPMNKLCVVSKVFEASKEVEEDVCVSAHVYMAKTNKL